MRSHRIRVAGTPGRDPVRRQRDVERDDARRAGPGAVIELQRTVGNRAVGTLLERDRVAAAPPVVQRKTGGGSKGEYGLDTTASQDRYVAHAVTLWKQQQRMTLVEFAKALLGTIAVELKQYGVPRFRWTFVSGAGASGSFDSKQWMVNVNVSKFSERTSAKTLGDLTLAEVTEVVGTLYHEARHTDQDVLIIRVLLDQKKTVNQIFAATGINKDVIKAVKVATYSDALDADEIAHAGRMYDVMYGAHKEFLAFLMRHSAAVEGLATLAQTGSTLSAGARHLKTFATWRSSVLQPKLKRMAAAKNPSAVETALRQRLENVDRALSALLAAWQKVAGAKRPTSADADDVRELASDVVTEIVATYQSLEGEKDAFRVEAEVKAAFGQKTGTP